VSRIALLFVLFLPSIAAAQAFRTDPGGPTLQIARRVRTGVQPKSVSVNPDGTRVVVCNFGRPDVDNVFVYDALTLDQVATVSFEGNAVESAWSPDGRVLYVSNFRRHMVEVIDTSDWHVTAEIAVGTNPKTIAVSRDGNTLYVANYFNHSVSVVDVRARRELRRLRTGERPRGMAVLGDGTLLAASFHGDRIHVFPPDATAQSTEWEVCRFPRDIIAAPEADTFLLTCSLGRIGFYRVSDAGRHFGIAVTGRNPRSIGLSRDGRWLGVANFTSNDVTLIDTVARTHRRVEIPRASGVVGLAMHPTGLRMYATSWDTGELIMLTGEVPAS
jgi:hyaluronoglucosaminidase